MKRTSQFSVVHLFAPLLLVALVTGCASTAPSSSATVAPFRERIEIVGRLSVRYQKDGKDESLSGSFNWVQSAARTDVRLTSPTGQTVATISVTPEQATLTQAGQAPIVERNIDTLTARTLGWPLPVAGLRDWLQGYAVAVAGVRFVASPAHASVDTQDGWHLRFVSWQDESAKQLQPKRIDALRGDLANGDGVVIRLVIVSRD